MHFRASGTLSYTYEPTGRSGTADSDYALARGWAELADPTQFERHEALKRFIAGMTPASTLRPKGGGLLCFRGRRRFLAGYSPSPWEMGPPPSASAPEGRYNKVGESVLYLCESERAVLEEPITGTGPLWIQRFVLPADQLAIADFSSVRGDDFLSKVFLFAELAGNPGVAVQLCFSQFVASLVSRHFDGMWIPGVRGNKNHRYCNLVMFRAESRWRDWLQLDAAPYAIRAETLAYRLQRTVMDKVQRVGKPGRL